jgi:hypothetical protein
MSLERRRGLMPAGLVHTQSRPVYKPKEGAWEHVQGKELE